MGSTELHQRIPPKRILVVEDEVVAALSIRTVLAADGHVAEIAENAEQALDMFKAAEYDLVITDFKLAKMDGLELADAIKQQSPATPIILITAYAEKIGGSLGEVSNVEVVLSKPFSVAGLQDAMRKLFPA
jgi:CheY-like chemotaxis protein